MLYFHSCIKGQGFLSLTRSGILPGPCYTGRGTRHRQVLSGRCRKGKRLKAGAAKAGVFPADPVRRSRPYPDVPFCNTAWRENQSLERQELIADHTLPFTLAFISEHARQDLFLQGPTLQPPFHSRICMGPTLEGRCFQAGARSRDPFFRQVLSGGFFTSPVRDSFTYPDYLFVFGEPLFRKDLIAGRYHILPLTLTLTHRPK